MTFYQRLWGRYWMWQTDPFVAQFMPTKYTSDGVAIIEV